jgi:hypothetical protein
VAWCSQKLHEVGWGALKEIALEYDRKPHDILIEAVDMVLQHYGRPTVAELTDNV